MQPLYQESIYLNEQQQQQQASSSSAASFSGGGGLDIPNSDGGVRNEMVFIPPTNDVVVTGLNESSSNDLSFQGGGLSLSLDKNKMQETSQLKHEDSSSSQQHHQGNNNNNNIAYTSAVEENLVFTDPKPDRVTTTGDYDSLMNYHQGFGVDDYNRYIGLGNQQDGRFSNPHQLHDFVV
ncbi:hypothetical protein F2Q70_00045476 [Brassica cretica]|uniref:Uncharacterized protein n=1 Tax=Brassica cretica TaxID=69181 RepID=A0A8S9KFE7_BRACR|nr:hypothetical protein F2Q70_00045476 [Brassica cretica]